MADRRQGPAPVTRLQFWVGICVSLVALAGVVWKGGQWTERVDSSVNSLQRTAERWETTSQRLIEGQTRLQLDVQKAASDIDSLRQRFNDRIERLPNSPLIDRGTAR